jgi:hypothetical protein
VVVVVDIDGDGDGDGDVAVDDRLAWPTKTLTKPLRGVGMSVRAQSKRRGHRMRPGIDGIVNGGRRRRYALVTSRETTTSTTTITSTTTPRPR